MAGNFKCPYKSWNMKKNILGLGATWKKPNKNFIFTYIIGQMPHIFYKDYGYKPSELF